jgi:Telomere repeat binding factor (TRF)
VAVSSKTWQDSFWISKLKYFPPHYIDYILTFIQAYISAMGQPTRDQSLFLADLFPSQDILIQEFVSRRSLPPLPVVPTQSDLTPTETEFIAKCERRKEALRTLGDSDRAVQELRDTYSWEGFLRDLRGYVAKNWELVVGSKGGKPRKAVKKRVQIEMEGQETGLDDGPEKSSPLAISSIHPTDPSAPESSSAAGPGSSVWEVYEKARLVTLPTPSGPAGSTMGQQPPTSSASEPAGTVVVKSTSDGSHIRRPWTKEEGMPTF